METRSIRNAFTVDVEDYFQVSGFERYVSRTTWGDYESRVYPNTLKLLELLADAKVRGTFFVLGWVANRCPRLVRQIHEAGHELGSHSYWHRLIYELSPEEFRTDLRDSRKAIEDAAGVRPTCFRAPSFSITRKSLWALDILREEGFDVDSSVFPTRHDRYGIPDARVDIHDLPLKSGKLCEFPPTVSSVAGVKIPAGGGGYFRLYPWQFSKYLLQRVNAAGRPFMFYVHPWEIDPDQPRLNFGSRATRFRHYVNLARTHRKLERLVRTFRFGSVADVISDWRQCADIERQAVEMPAAAAIE